VSSDRDHESAGESTDEPRIDLRETYRAQLQASIGGWRGMVIAGLPPIVFIVVVALTSLRPALIAAVATAVVLASYRLARKQPVQQAISGLVGVLVAALIAARTGQARGYFLLGIWQSFIYAVPFAVSLVVRRPLVGLAWEYLDPTPGGDGVKWFRRKRLFAAYMWATLFGLVLFLSRGIVQALLYHHNATGWLAFARIAMGYPLFVIAVAAGWWVVSRARRGIGRDDAAPDASVADDTAVDRGFGLG